MNKSKISDTFIAIVILMWFFSSLFGGIYFFKTDNIHYGLMLFGQFLFVPGVIVLVDTIKNKKWSLSETPVLLFVVVGFALIVIPFLSHNKDYFNINIDFERLTIFLVLLLFFIVGVFLIFSFFYKKNESNNQKLLKTHGEILNLRIRYSNGKKLYAPDIKYTFNGKQYIYESKSYTNIDVSKKGKIIKIKIDPSNPEIVYYESKANYILLFLGIMFCLNSLSAIYFIFLNKY